MPSFDFVSEVDLNELENAIQNVTREVGTRYDFRNSKTTLELMKEANAQMAATPQLVQYWMNWMAVIFFVSILFVKNHKGARYALVAMPLTMLTALGIFYFSRNVHLFGIAHLMFWLPLLIYLVKKEIKGDQFELKSRYGVWVSLLCLTISISLVFDIRDIFLVVIGKK